MFELDLRVADIVRWMSEGGCEECWHRKVNVRVLPTSNSSREHVGNRLEHLRTNSSTRIRRDDKLV